METKKKESIGGFLGLVEKVGNMIPHPIFLFMGLMAIIAIVSFAMSGNTVVNPATNKDVVIKNIISGEGISFSLTTMVKNFTSFAPLGLVLSMTLGIGLAEEVGLFSAFMRKSILGANEKLVVPIIFLVGICGNIASDAAIVIVPTLAAMIYLYLGKNPIAGIAAGFAATTGGFSANLMIAGTDALLQGLTNEASSLVNGPTINVASNWFIMIASTFLLTIVGTIINNKIIEPKLGEYHGDIKVSRSEINREETRGLKAALIALAIYVLIIVAICIPESSFMRNAKTGSLTTDSTLMKGIIPIILMMFLVVSIAYGKRAGTIEKISVDVPRIMNKAIASMSSFIVLAFIIGQFIAWFNWTNIGSYLAINLADSLKNSGFVGIPLFIGYIGVCAIVNLLIGSGSAKWALLAPVFVPMMVMLGYHPSWTQFLYRIGDSCTNVISPIFPYFPIILSFLNEYDEDAGTGTLISMMLPYSIGFLIVWTLFAIAWTFTGLPIGIEGQVLL